MKNKIKNFFTKDSTISIFSSIVSICIGLLIGLVVMVIIAIVDKKIGVEDAFDAIGYIIKGPFSAKTSTNTIKNLGNTIFYSTPLIMTGLSVGIAYKTGLFNIGAPGQYIMGIIGCLIVALNIDCSSNRTLGVFVWILALCNGALLGALWGMIPGALKAFFNINEVISSIMTNWIAANLSSMIFSKMPNIISQENTKAAYLIKTATKGTYTPSLGLGTLFKGSYIDIGIFIAIIIAIVIFIILNKTTFGYSLKACGLNRSASKYAGMNEKRNIIVSMAIAGALAGIGAGLYYLNPGIEYNFLSQYSQLPAYGFNGIASSFLASCNPIGTIFSSVLIRHLSQGGEYLTMVGFNRYIADIVISIIIYLSAISMLVMGLIKKILKGKQKTQVQMTVEELDVDMTDDLKDENVVSVDNIIEEKHSEESNNESEGGNN